MQPSAGQGLVSCSCHSPPVNSSNRRAAPDRVLVVPDTEASDPWSVSQLLLSQELPAGPPAEADLLLRATA